MHPQADHLEFSSRRSPVYSLSGMVAASQPLAVAAGLKILQQGGSAADSAIAVAAALNVTEPASTGLGGDCFCLYYEAATGKVHALNGSGRAPAALTLERLQAEGFGVVLPPYHAYTVTVPGAAAGWIDLGDRFGRLELTETLAPAVLLAERGFPVAPLSNLMWAAGANRQLSTAFNGRELTIGGRAPHTGEVFRNPGLARVLRLLAEGGKEVFYRGEIAGQIAQAVQAAGGCLTEEDLARHESTWEEPISVEYHGFRFWECPPNGQGLAALLALNLLRGLDQDLHEALTPLRLHLEIEAMRAAFADSLRYIADASFSAIPVAELLSEAYAGERRKVIDPRRANPELRHGQPLGSSDTVYLSVVDGEGNACSFINSNYMGFGTGIVPPGLGFSLQNRGHGFNLDPAHPNALQPGKRPYHTIIPAMATRADGSLYACFGVMGGFMQPQGHMQVARALVNDGLDPQAALDRPRFCIQPGSLSSSLELEEGIPSATASALEEMGHQVKTITGHRRVVFGRGQVIMRDPASGVLCGGSDPRGDGCAMALD